VAGLAHKPPCPPGTRGGNPFFCRLSRLGLGLGAEGLQALELAQGLVEAALQAGFVAGEVGQGAGVGGVHAVGISQGVEAAWVAVAVLGVRVELGAVLEGEGVVLGREAVAGGVKTGDGLTLGCFGAGAFLGIPAICFDLFLGRHINPRIFQDSQTRPKGTRSVPRG
jgi:hypothetical protein